jgi:hypothetical protein
VLWSGSAGLISGRSGGAGGGGDPGPRPGPEGTGGILLQWVRRDCLVWRTICSRRRVWSSLMLSSIMQSPLMQSSPIRSLPIHSSLIQSALIQSQLIQSRSSGVGSAADTVLWDRGGTAVQDLTAPGISFTPDLHQIYS